MLNITGRNTENKISDVAQAREDGQCGSLQTLTHVHFSLESFEKS